MKIENLYPEKVFHYFSEISKIPRGSNKEKKISDWIVEFAKERNLEVVQDKAFNVFIRKPATAGYKEYSPLILQGHMDMVWEKNKNTQFDFETQGIELVAEDGFLKAKGTTLGADNGIAVAYALAILDSDDLKHPELEIILTTDEEDGMSGVNNLDFGIFSGKTLINLDTEEYGQVYVSSAGGARIFNEFNFDAEKLEDDDTVISVDVKGLLGGHSGAEIHLGLGNSNKILTEVLNHLNKKYTLSIMDIDGGEKTNAIPREAVALLAVKLEDENVSDFEKLAKLAFENVTKDFKIIDKNPVIEVEEIKKEELKNQGKMSISNTNAVISFFHEFPNGVIAMSKDIEGLVETSINLGVIKTENKDGKISIKVQALPRSSVNKSLDEIMKKVIEVSEKHGATVRIDSSYMSWEYRENSKIRDIATEAFKKVANKDPEIRAIHAGLECGIFDVNIKDLDIISVGPNIFGAHTPEERMEIWSVQETWDWLLEILKNAKIEK
mgnify:FL=1